MSNPLAASLHRVQFIEPFSFTDTVLIVTAMGLVSELSSDSQDSTSSSLLTQDSFVTIDQLHKAVSILGFLKKRDNPYYYLWATRFVYNDKLTNVFTFLHNIVRTYGGNNVVIKKIRYRSEDELI